MLTTIAILVAAGLAALFLEVFLPGGVVGIAGALALATAIFLLFFADSLGWSLGARALAVLGVLVVSAAVFAASMKQFHRSPMGRSVTLTDTSGHWDGAARAKVAALVGREGRAVTPLMPGGKAQIAGEKWDVLSESGAIRTQSPLVVTRIDGRTIYVREVSGETAGTASLPNVPT